MRALAALAALAACGSPAPPRAAVAAHTPTIDDALPCVADREAAVIATSRTPGDALISALDLRAFPTPLALKTKFIEALAGRLLEMRGLALPRARVRARTGYALLHIGASAAARKHADSAIAEGGFDEDLYELTLALTATGGEPPVSLDRAQAMVKLAAAEGYARNGRKERSREVLAALSVDALTLPEKGVYLQTLAWLGDTEAGRRVVAGQPDLILRAWFGRALVDARHPDAGAILDGYLAEAPRVIDASPPDQLVTAVTVWDELVWYRETLDAATAGPAREAYDTWLLAVDDGRAELRNMNVVRAADAGNTAEVVRLQARLLTPLRRVSRISLAMLRDDVTSALDVLSEKDPPLEHGPQVAFVLDAPDGAEGYAWLLLASKQRTALHIRRFHEIVCRPGERTRTSTK